jgi:hypothetical protein
LVRVEFNTAEESDRHSRKASISMVSNDAGKLIEDKLKGGGG